GLAVFGLLLAPSPLAAADVNQAKANMLANIARFVEWPGLPTEPGTPLVVTILGEDDLAVELAGVLSTKSVNGRPVFVRFARRPQDAKGSQILYVAATEVPRIHDVLSAVNALPVLTVSDAPGFATHGGMLGFTQVGEKVRFEVNLAHAEKTGLKLSAKLLALARLVSDTPGTP
ncbi:MAG: YfiR family protein, partial [Candidatus Eisenbacteria bacterium]